jgi:thioredoxin reductase (NADPH)
MISFDSSKHSSFDVVVIGGGPGGLSAAAWCVELGLTAFVVESGAEPGGQLLWIHNPINNHLGARYEDGLGLRDAILDQVTDSEFVVSLGSGVQAIDESNRFVTLSDGTQVGFEYLVLATGLSRRRIGLESEIDFLGKGVLVSGAGQRESVSGKVVAIVGGGDAAVENALILSEHASKVFLIHRRERFTARNEMVDALGSKANIEVIFNNTLQSIEGRESLSSITIADVNQGVARSIDVDHLLIRIGFAPNSSLLNGIVEMDDSGFIKVVSEFRTSHSRIYAIGDVACPIAPTISGAIGAGSIAAKSIYCQIKN